MIGLLRSLFSILVAATAILFALGNLEMTKLNWNPFTEPLDLPVFVIGLGGVLVGFICGGFMVWMNGAVVRKERRKQKKTIRDLEAKLDKAEKEENNKALLIEDSRA